MIHLARLLVAVTALGVAGPVLAAEFQPLGTLGMGGAGVARPPEGMAPYWNPAALARGRSVFATKPGAGAGLTLNNGLAGDVDRLSRLDVPAIQSFTGDTDTDRRIAGNVVEAIALLDKIDRENGALTARAHAVLGNQIRRIGFGAYGSFEAAALPDPDLVNVLPQAGGVPVSAAAFEAAIGAGTAPPSAAFFSAAQRAEIEGALAGAGVSDPSGVVDVFDAQLAASNAAQVTAAEATAGLITFADALAAGGSLANNTSALRNRGLAYLEVPLSYGHPVPLGPLGTLGVGASAKLLSGRVYVSEITIFGLESGDIVNELRDSYEDSTTWSVDAGLLWMPNGAIAVGLVGKHLNDPTFDAPVGGDVELGRQMRAGLAVSPLGWLTFAADLDLTTNDTALVGYESRVLGGGLELHPFTWLRLRGGAYRNLAESDIGTVLTAGFTIGIPWLTVDLDGAMATEMSVYDRQKYPADTRAQLSVSLSF